MKAETKVGIMFVVAFLMAIGFAYLLGAISIFSSGKPLTVAYNFAGGIEVGSPVRVMGIKVGKVRSIKFDPNFQMPNGEAVNLKMEISIDQEAWGSLRQDSAFYINLAGVIGEKFLEITPGSMDAAPLRPGDLVRGQDPPRIDQMISQSYSLAGKILDMVEKNEGSVVNTLETMNKLVVNFDKLLRQLDKTTNTNDMSKLLRNFIVISDDVAFFTQSIRSAEGQKTVRLMNELIQRLDPLDAKAIRKFLQEEGIKAKLF